MIYKNRILNKECLICKKDISDINNNTYATECICEECKELTPNELTKKFVLSEGISTDPLDMFITISKHPNIKVSGPQHHFIVPAVLLTAYYNALNNHEAKVKNLIEVENRSKNILGGFCGYYGDCGAAVAGGIVYSIINEVTPFTPGEPWKDCNLITSECLNVIAQTEGPRCCKAICYKAIITASEFIERKMGVKFDIKNKAVKCEFRDTHQYCKGKRCSFHER